MTGLWPLAIGFFGSLVGWLVYRYFTRPGPGGTRWVDSRVSDQDMANFISQFLEMFRLEYPADSLVRFVWDAPSRSLHVVSVRTGRVVFIRPGDEILENIEAATVDVSNAAVEAMMDWSQDAATPPTLTDEVTDASWMRLSHGVSIRGSIASPPIAPSPARVSYPAGRRLILRSRRDEDAAGGES